MERTNHDAHLMPGGWRFFGINNDINFIGSSADTRRETSSRRLRPTRRVLLGHSPHRRLQAHKSSCAELLCMGSPYRAPSRRNRRVESSHHSPDKFITMTSPHNSASSTLGGSRTRGLNVAVAVTSSSFSPRRLFIFDYSTA